jgi:chaperonin GroEL (HSP60 family)
LCEKGLVKEAYLMYAEALERIPQLLAQNAGANPTEYVVENR